MASFGKVYDPATDGFPYHRLLHAATVIAKLASEASARYSYGAWNPDCMAREEADEAIRFFSNIEEVAGQFKRQALQAKAAAKLTPTSLDNALQAPTPHAQPRR